MRTQFLFLFGAVLCGLLTAFNPAYAQSTAFTYQGRLTENVSPANGIYDLRFTIYDSSGGGNAVAGPLTNSATPVSNGLFTVTLDFGSAPFDGGDRWLELSVGTNGTGVFTPLAPRQPITATPYAIRAANFSGAVADGQLSANVARLNANQTFSGSVQFTNPANAFAGTFSGNGASVTNVLLETIYTESAIVPAGLPGTFTLVSTLMVGSNPIVVRVADVNQDGSLDFISANQGNNTLSVLTNDGGGNFTLAVTLAPTNLLVRALVVGDINGDGAPDLAADHLTPFPVRLAVFTNDGSGGFISVPQPSLPGFSITRDMAMGLLDAGGSLDVLLSLSTSSSGQHYLGTNNGAGLFTASIPPAFNLNSWIELADLTGDGRADIVASGPSFRVLINNGSGVFTTSSILNPGLSGLVRPRVAEMNNDGRLDITCTSQTGNSLSVLTNAGGGQLTLMTTNAVPGAPVEHTAAHVNGDAYLDLITVNSTNNSVTVLTNNGGGGFGLVGSTAVGTNPVFLATGDWNGDGRTDLVVANNTDGTLSVLFGNNRYAFTGSFIGIGTGLSGLNASSLTLGTVPGDRLAGTYPNAVTFNNPANSFSGSFTGNGAGLSNLSANAISGGLTTNIAILVPGPKTNTLFFTNGILRAVQ